ncbi:Nucleoporin nup57, partial [Candidozyma auris]
SNTGSGLFGGSTVNNAQPSFSWSSQQQQKPQQSSVLNLPTLSNSSSSNPQSSSSTSSTYTPPINDQLIKLKEQWDPNSPKCALKTHFYNKFSQEEINALMQQPRPSNESPDDWDNAMSERPSTQHYPVKITSFSDVSQRIETQLDHIAKARILLNNINEKQTQLSSKHDLDNITRILKARAKHTKLSRRLLRLATVLAILKLKGYPLLPEEEEISKQFQTLNTKLSDPTGPVGKLSDLYARLAILKGRSEDISSQLESSIGNIHVALNDVMGSNEGTHVGVQESSNQIDQIVNKLTKLLYKQQVGLSYLNELLQKDMDTVDKRLAAQN